MPIFCVAILLEIYFVGAKRWMEKRKPQEMNNRVGHENIAIWNCDIAIFFKNKQFLKIAILPYGIAILPYSPKNQQISIIAILPYSLKL